MATLEKIRSKSVLLFVIIIVALLAFILGDFLTSGQTYFGTGTTVAKAGNAKVEYQDYSARINAASEQSRNSQQTPDNDELSQQVITELLTEKLLEQEYNDLGIVVTDKEITEALTGAQPHPYAMQFIGMLSQQLGLPTASGAEVYQAMMNPAKYNLPVEAGAQLQQYWAAMEKDLEAYLKADKFNALMLGLYTANELDAQSMYNDVATTRHITYATKEFNSVSNDDAQINDDDRRAAWEENKGMYRLEEPIRSIDYIMVRIEPSQADRLAGQQAVENALLSLNTTEGTEAVNADSKFVVNRASAPKSKITDKDLVAFLDSAAVGKAALIKNIGDNYTIAKLLGVTNDVDSINVTMIGRADQGSLDSIMSQLNAGTSVATLLEDENIQGQDSVWASLLATGIPTEVKNALVNNAVGTPFILTDTIQGQAISTLYRINKRHAPVAVYDIAVIDYTVDPSQETLSDLSTSLNTFVSNNSSAADFAANAAEAGYTVLSNAISASSPHVATATDSRPAVKWLMGAKKGQVMPVYQDNKQSYLLTAAVKEIYDGEYLPWNADIIAPQIDAAALKNKKAAILAERYAGKAQDVAGYAKLMEVEAQDGDAIFSAPMLATIGFNESAVQGAIAAAEKGKVVGPIKGNNSMVVFVVTGEETTEREFNFAEYANQFNRSLGLGNARQLQNPNYMLHLLLGNGKVKNNSLNFVQGFGE